MGERMRISILVLVMLAYVLEIHTEEFKINKPQSVHIASLALVYDQEVLHNDAVLLQKMLASTGVMEATLFVGSMPITKKQITDYLPKGFSTVLFIQQDHDHIRWRLYDTTQAEMLLGKQTGSSSSALTIRLIADAVYTYLFNHESYFLTKLAYIKKTPTVRNKKRTELCLLDPVDGHSTTILKDARILVAPEWAAFSEDNASKIWLTVSEFTPGNVRLLGLDMKGRTWPIIDVEGTCVGVAQYNDCTFAYSKSGTIWLYSYDKKSKKGVHRRLTKAHQTCGCPSFLKSGDIIYSSNGKIYRYAMNAQESLPLPLVGNCMGPDVHAATDRIVFSRSINGVLQIHACNSQGEAVKQLTFGPGNKVDPCWSACGNYIAYTRCHEGREQIALLNCLNGVEKIVTPAEEYCGYPAWSDKSSRLYA